MFKNGHMDNSLPSLHRLLCSLRSFAPFADSLPHFARSTSFIDWTQPLSCFETNLSYFDSDSDSKLVCCLKWWVIKTLRWYFTSRSKFTILSKNSIKKFFFLKKHEERISSLQSVMRLWLRSPSIFKEATNKIWWYEAN